MASTRRFLLALPVFALVMAAGCDEHDAPADLDTSELHERFACDDLTVVAASDDGEHALMVGIDDGLAANALAYAGAVEATYTLPDERLTVRWVSGSNVYQGHCGRDSGEPWGLDDRTDAVSGEVIVRVVPDGLGGLSLDASLYDVVLASDDEDEPERLLAQAEFSGLTIDS